MQTTTGIKGTVTDPSGAVVAGADVTVREQNTGAVFHGKTSASGVYTFPSINPGVYSVTVSMSGFKTSVVTNRVVQVAQPASVDVTLSVGSTTQTVQVSASGAELITTNTAEISGTINPTLVENLPMNGHDMFDLAVLTPGTSPQDLTTDQISRADQKATAWRSNVHCRFPACRAYGVYYRFWEEL